MDYCTFHDGGHVQIYTCYAAIATPKINFCHPVSTTSSRLLHVIKSVHTCNEIGTYIYRTE